MKNMNRLLRLAFVAILVCISGAVYGQGAGVKGILKDEQGNPIVNANVEVTQGGIVSGRELTDFDGNYTVRPLNGGRYDVKFSYLGRSVTVTGVIVPANQLVTVNSRLTTSTEIKGIEVNAVRGYVVPIIDPEKPGGSTTITKERLTQGNIRSAAEAVTLSAQVQTNRNGGISIGGGRSSGTKYIIDGVQLNPGQSNFVNPAPGNVEAITTYSSGVPARYGDASGGVVAITTSGASARTMGNVQYEHSLEGYNQNQLTLNLSGPLLRKKDSFGNYRPIIGYNIVADGVYSSDNNPVYDRSYYVKDDVLAQLREHPLIVIPNNGVNRTDYRTQFVTADDFETKKRQPNSEYYRSQLGGKLDFNLTDNVSVRVGANYFYLDAPSYSRGRSLFSPENFARLNNQTGRGYIRFTQKFGNTQTSDGKLKDGTITNAFYTVQADYSRDYSTTQDKNKKHNTFEYGYVGKFEERFAPAFMPGGIDDSTGKVGIRLMGYQPVGVTFTPGSQNPILANYTRDLYAFNPNPLDQNDIIAGRGLRNGDVPPLTYNLFNNVGSTTTGWNKSNAEQVAFQVDASFDIKHRKTTHSVEFGLYYQQRNTRAYGINGSYLWTLMRQISNRVVNQEVDQRYATFIVNGQKYSWLDVRNGVITPGPNDTILYERKFDTSAQSAFDRNMREKLFQNQYSTNYVNTDAYDPSFYSMDMFSADDVLNGGQNTPVSYYGYDYTGKAITGTVNFNDFWTARDSRGNYTRPIGSYRPNYIAGYISDYIQYKDFRITLGARVERFDNNTKVLKDPYSFYAVKTASQVPFLNPDGSQGNHPRNIGDDFVVYVGDNSSQNSSIIGYRNGDTWYDAQGREVEDPRVLQTETGSQGVEPVLQNRTARMTDTGNLYNPDESFTDYTPQVNVMPRINFSFPLNDNALFYAHYDIMYQRPNTGAFATQTDYMFVEQNASQVYGNSNLKPERVIDYEVGFQQKLTDNSGVTISGFYRERKDQIQVRPYIYAFPITYFTYGNRDYSTYKGLSLTYDLRRLGNLSMNVNYTLSFTEGTGSSATSANGGDGNNVSQNSLLTQLVAAGLPNLRTQFPVDFDSRHNISAQIDYRFREGGGPMIGSNRILENSGINLIFRARSGEPYTKYATAQNLQSGAPNSPVIDGTVNGSRLTGHYNFDLNVDKVISLGGKKSADGVRTPGRLSVTLYAYAKNVFNIRDVINVYGYTGRADDDGYLTSPIGLTTIASQADAQSFSDLYRISAANPNNIGAPRTIFVGVRLNF